MVQEMGQGLGMGLWQTRIEVVYRRKVECQLQLSGQTPGNPRQQGRFDLAGGTSGRKQGLYLPTASLPCLQIRQCPQETRREERGPRHHLSADDPCAST